MQLVIVAICVLALGTAVWCLRLLQREQVQHKQTRHALRNTRRKLYALQEDHSDHHTDRAATEKKLRRYLQLMDTLVNTIPNPIYYKDPQGVFQGCNDIYAKQILGLTRDHIIGCRPQQLPEKIPAVLAATCQRHERIALEKYGFHSFEAPVLCAEGVQRDFLFSLAAIRDAKGQPIGCVSVLVDLTEKNRSAEVRMQKEKLEGVLETAGAVCHELNQPLQALSGYVELLGVVEKQNPTAQSYLNNINSQIERMGLITAKLQGITRYETMLYANRTKIIDIHKASTVETPPVVKVDRDLR